MAKSKPTKQVSKRQTLPTSSNDTAEIREFISFIAQSGLSEVNIETDWLKLSVKRNQETTAPIPLYAAPVPPPAPSGGSSAGVPAAPTTPKPEISAKEELLSEIKSPMIGTFYQAPSPDNPPFVSVGDKIKKGQVVCVIEAMKLFNEIESELEGTIVKILVENASPVEYDQPLFLVRAD